MPPDHNHHHCHDIEDLGTDIDETTRTAYRRVLIIVLILNGGMFVVELVSGLFASSVSLQADALDFFGDASNYALSLFVLNMALRWRAAVGLLKGLTMGAFGIFVLGMTLWRVLHPVLPSATIMGGIGALALAVNVVSAIILYRHRGGDSNMRSVWLCSRNDAIANVAVILAGIAVALTASNWPDLVVGMIIAGLSLTASVAIVRQAIGELRPTV